MKSVSTDKHIEPIVVDKTTVFLRSNIKKRSGELDMWEYDEERIPVANFIASLRQENELIKTEQTQTNNTLLELMELVLIGGI